MHYILYKTTNLINRKIYVGVHKINNNNNRSKYYLGSGRALKSAIKLYGSSNFKREMLCIGTRDYIYELEGKYVDREFVDREDTYNLIIGGVADCPWLSPTPITEEIIAKRAETRKANNNPKWHHTEEHKEYMSNKMKSLPDDNPAIKSQFKKGMTPHNKGKKMGHHSTGKPVSIDGVQYPSAQNAAELLNIAKRTLHNRIQKDSFPDCFYV